MYRVALKLYIIYVCGVCVCVCVCVICSLEGLQL